MDNIKYIPLSLFVLFSGKALLVGVSSLESAAALLILGGIAAFYEFKSQDKALVALKKQIEEQNKLIEENKKELNEVKTHVASFKLQTQFRQKAL